MSNVDINVDRRTDGRKIGRLYRTLLQAGAIKMLHIYKLYLMKKASQSFFSLKKPNSFQSK